MAKAEFDPNGPLKREEWEWYRRARSVQQTHYKAQLALKSWTKDTCYQLAIAQTAKEFGMPIKEYEERVQYYWQLLMAYGRERKAHQMDRIGPLFEEVPDEENPQHEEDLILYFASHMRTIPAGKAVRVVAQNKDEGDLYLRVGKRAARRLKPEKYTVELQERQSGEGALYRIVITHLRK